MRIWRVRQQRLARADVQVCLTFSRPKADGLVVITAPARIQVPHSHLPAFWMAAPRWQCSKSIWHRRAHRATDGVTPVSRSVSEYTVV